MNYYSEFDPKAAAWLRELIAAGLIPDGKVDERDIRDVQATDLRGFTQCHFFAGIGGWSLALRFAGWPDTREVWTGSCPCQPFSEAGKGKGESDPRHLWPELRRLIAECRPATCFGEQVASKAGRKWLARVRADLEAMGSAVGCADLCAAGTGQEAEGWVVRGDTIRWERIVVGPPHIRQRLFWVADAKRPVGRADVRGGLHEPDREGQDREEAERSPSGSCADVGGPVELRGVADADGGVAGDGRLQPGGKYGFEPQDGGAVRVGDTVGTGREGRRASLRGKSGDGTGCEPSAPTSDAGGLGNSDRRRLGERLQPNGHATQDPDDSGSRGTNSGGSGDSFWTAFDVIPCRDGKARRVESGTFPLAHGVPGRVGLLRGYGNAIVPQVAAEFIRAFVEAKEEAVTH